MILSVCSQNKSVLNSQTLLMENHLEQAVIEFRAFPPTLLNGDQG